MTKNIFMSNSSCLLKFERPVIVFIYKLLELVYQIKHIGEKAKINKGGKFELTYLTTIGGPWYFW